MEPLQVLSHNFLFIKMEINEIEKKIYDAKLRLRGWEKKFNKKHGRQPTVEDINKRPDVGK